MYDEIVKDSNDSLINLNKVSGLIITKNGLNIRVAEKIIENSLRELNRIKIIERYLKIENFIQNTKIEICIQINEKKNEISFENNSNINNN